MATQPQTESRAVATMTPQRESYSILKDRARLFSMSPLIPEQLRAGGPDQAAANCLIALQMAEAMGEMPLVVMQNIHIVKGKAGFAAQYMIARANASGVFKGRINWRIEGKGESLSATAYAVLSDTGEEVAFTCDMAMAKAEGWVSNPKYKTMPEVMLRYRSATFLVRFYAPDVMLGYQTAEEVEDVVLAAEPTAAPVTAAALLEQARTDDPPQPPSAGSPPAGPDADPPTAAAVEEEPPQPAKPSLQERMQAVADSAKPTQDRGASLDVEALAQQLIAEAKGQPDALTLAGWEKDMEPRYQTLPDPLRLDVDAAIRARKIEVGG